jgi:hypothetical protein
MMKTVQDYINALEFERTHIYLIGYGWAPVKLGNELRAGDKLRFNYGSTGVIKSITPSKSGKTAQMVVIENGEEYSRRISMAAKYAVVRQ